MFNQKGSVYLYHTKSNHMAYLSADRVKAIRSEIKKAFPAFKFSITRENHSGVRIIIAEGPIPFRKDIEQVNNYYIKEAHTGAAKDVLLTINKIANEGVTYYETGDYGNQPSHYVWIQVGTYDAPYRMILNNEVGRPIGVVKLKTLKAA